LTFLGGLAFAGPGAAVAPAQKIAPDRGEFAPFDLTYLPGFGPQGIVGLRPAEIVRKTPACARGAEVRALVRLFFAQCAALAFDADLSAAEPPGFEELEECVFGVMLVNYLGSDKEQGSFIAGLGSPCVLRTTKPFDWAGVVSKWFPRAEKISWAGREYLANPFKIVLPNKQPCKVGVFVANTTTLVLGDEAQVRDLLTRLQGGKPALTAPPGWKEHERELIALALVQPSSCVRGQWPAGPHEINHLRTIVEGASGFAAGLRIGERTEVRLTYLGKDQEAARGVAEAVRWLLASARKGVDAETKSGPSTQPLKLLQEALVQAVFTRTGRRLRVCAGVGCNVLGLFAAALEKPNVLEQCEVLPPPVQPAGERK
jgi:hypothetical protein